MTTATQVEQADTLPPLLTVREAATLLGVSHVTAYAMDGRGELPTFGTGQRRVIRNELMRLIGVPETAA